MRFACTVLFVITLTSCFQKTGTLLPPDISGDLVPINKTQVINYGS